MKAFGIFLLFLALWMVWFVLSRTVKAFAYGRKSGWLAAVLLTSLLFSLVRCLLG